MALQPKPTLRARLGTVSSTIALFAALVPPIVIVVTQMRERSDAENSAHLSREELLITRRQHDEQLAALTKRLDSLTQVSPDAKIAGQIEELIQAQKKLDAREANLEAAMETSPEKAIAMPMLRRDLDNLKADEQDRLEAIRKSVDQVYDMNKTVLLAMSIGVIGLAASNLLRRPSSTESGAATKKAA